MLKRFLGVSIIFVFAISCTEVWELKVDGDGSEIANTLCVAANATIVNGVLSFAAAVAPVRSEVIKYQSYPLDGLWLDLNVDGVSYRVDSLSMDYLFGTASGFRIDSIIVDNNTPTIAMEINDNNHYYSSVKGITTALPPPPEMNVEIASIKVKYQSQLDKYEDKYEIVYIPPGRRYEELSIAGCDSIYVASITFKDPPAQHDYYMLAVEFECFEDLFEIYENQDKDGNYLATDYAVVKSFGSYEPARWKNMGYYPFYSDDNVFFDEDITRPVSGFGMNFSNIFNDSTFDGNEKSIIITFKNLFPVICDTDFRSTTRRFHFSSNGETPFHIYLMSMSESDYKNYKAVNHHLSAGGSLLDCTQNFISNVVGGLGYFSVLNSRDYFYYDDLAYLSWEWYH